MLTKTCHPALPIHPAGLTGQLLQLIWISALEEIPQLLAEREAEWGAGARAGGCGGQGGGGEAQGSSGGRGQGVRGEGQGGGGRGSPNKFAKGVTEPGASGKQHVVRAPLLQIDNSNPLFLDWTQKGQALLLFTLKRPC